MTSSISSEAYEKINQAELRKLSIQKITDCLGNWILSRKVPIDRRTKWFIEINMIFGQQNLHIIQDFILKSEESNKFLPKLSWHINNCNYSIASLLKIRVYEVFNMHEVNYMLVDWTKHKTYKEVWIQENY